MEHDLKITPITAVDELDTEIVSNAASYTVTCRYRGTDEPAAVSWKVAGSVVSDSDEDGLSIDTGALNLETSER